MSGYDLLQALRALPCTEILSGDVAVTRARSPAACTGGGSLTPVRGAGVRGDGAWCVQRGLLQGREVVVKAPVEVLHPRTYGVDCREAASRLWRSPAGPCYAAAEAVVGAAAVRCRSLTRVEAVYLQPLHGVLVVRCVCFSPPGPPLSPPMEVGAALRAVAAAADAVRSLHRAGRPHGGVSQRLVRGSSAGAVLDISLTAAAPHPDGDEGWVGGDASAEDPRWRAPEPEKGFAADVYSLAAFFWWAVGCGAASHDERWRRAERAVRESLPHLAAMLRPLSADPRERPDAEGLYAAAGQRLLSATLPPDPDVDGAAAALAPPSPSDHSAAAAEWVPFAAEQWAADLDTDRSAATALQQRSRLGFGRHCDAFKVWWRGCAAVLKQPTRLYTPDTQEGVLSAYGPGGGAAALQWEVAASSRVSHPGAARFVGAVYERRHGVPVCVGVLHEYRHCGPSETMEAAPTHLPLPPATIALRVRSVARTLQHMHGLGFAHLGVHPGRLYIDADGEVTLGDLVYTRERAGERVGRLPYRAPGMADGAAGDGFDRIEDAPADVYGVGCVALTEWCGVRPARKHSDRMKQFEDSCDRCPDLRPLLPLVSEKPSERPGIDDVLRIANRILSEVGCSRRS